MNRRLSRKCKYYVVSGASPYEFDITFRGAGGAATADRPITSPVTPANTAPPQYALIWLHLNSQWTHFSISNTSKQVMAK